jgi:hypothetical protein
MRGRTCRKAASKTELDLPILRRLRSATARFPPRGKCGRAQTVSGSHRGVTLSWLMPPPSIAIPPAAAAGFGISRADNGASPSAISAETDRCAADVVVEFDHLHGEPEPGRRHPVKAVSRRSRAREQRELLTDGTGLAPYLEAGDDDVGDTHSPVERCRRSPHHIILRYRLPSRA